MESYAHLKKENENWKKHTLSEHLEGVAKFAKFFANEFNCDDWGHIVGMLHDLGKTSNEFQEYIRYVTEYDTTIKTKYKSKGPDHSTASAKYAKEKYGELGKLLGYITAGHHSGIPNGKDNEESCLERRVNDKKICDYNEPDEFKDLKIPNITNVPFEGRPTGFAIQSFVRMLYSCLVDADFLDTERFMNPDDFAARSKYPDLIELEIRLHKTLNSFDSMDSKINKIRANILSNCLNVADSDSGLFSLTVPTGGGKTLSSLAFALKHAIKHNKKRIIYVIPYTSIIEQNADVFRKALGNEAVLEHHSNFDPDSKRLNSDTEEYSAYTETLASQNWDAPLIVTTNVQFFESLFANRSSRCRKLHNIANSVIILDEAQMLPIELLEPCLEAINELVKGYKTSIVLCTATQPTLGKSEILKKGLENVKEIINNPKELYESLKRVNVEDIGTKSNEELAELIQKEKQALCIVSTKKHAKELFDLVKDKDKNIFHLSSLMCPEHRTNKLNEIRKKLDNEESCIVISTQLIEAGVDVDFPVVFRSIAGIDSIAQAAGRCNREDKLEKGSVYIFKPENTKLIPPGFLKHCSETGEQVLRHHSDPLSLESVEEYFKRLFTQKKNNMDTKQILNKINSDAPRMNFPFKDIARDFNMINSDTRSIIIPYEEAGADICKKIRDAEENYEFPERKIIRKAQRYTVQVHPFIFDKLRPVISSYCNEQFNILESKDLYKDSIGLTFEDITYYDKDTLIIQEDL